MYLDFYQLKHAPFQSAPDPTWLFGSASHQAAIDALAAGLATRQGVVVITGAPGVGKTTVVHAYLARVAPPLQTTVVLWQARLAFRELLALLARRFDVPVQMDALGAMLAQLQQRFRHAAQQGCPVALLIDEAQDLPLETLAQLPLLAPLSASQEPLLQIGLVGQPALLQHLRRQRRVAQRIGHQATIRPLTEAESLAYIRQRVARVALPGGPIFTPEALQTIIRHAHGVPRDLNLLCTTVLQAGCWVQQQPITAELVQQVLAASRGSQPWPWRRLGLATAAGLVLTAGLLGVALFQAGLQASRSGPAVPARSWMEALRSTRVSQLKAARPPQSAPPASAASTPDSGVGHDPGEGHVRLAPRESLESQRLETPPTILTTPATPPPSADPPLPAALTPHVIVPSPATPMGITLKSCDELKAEIQAKLDAKRVTGYTLTIITSGDVQGQHIVGSCEGSTKRIALHRSRSMP